jgi:hypothetical protein
MPETMSRPASSAATRLGIHSGFSTPPVFATPITIERAPLACASRGESFGRPAVTVAVGSANSPTQRSRAQSRRPNAVFA